MRGVALDQIHNERTKLTATWLNGLSLAFFGVGALGPAFGVVVIIVISAILLRDRWKARHSDIKLHPGE